MTVDWVLTMVGFFHVPTFWIYKISVSDAHWSLRTEFCVGKQNLKYEPIVEAEHIIITSPHTLNKYQSNCILKKKR